MWRSPEDTEIPQGDPKFRVPPIVERSKSVEPKVSESESDSESDSASEQDHSTVEVLHYCPPTKFEVRFLTFLEWQDIAMSIVGAGSSERMGVVIKNIHQQAATMKKRSHDANQDGGTAAHDRIETLAAAFGYEGCYPSSKAPSRCLGGGEAVTLVVHNE